MPSPQDLNAFRRPWFTGSTGFAEELPDDESLRVGGVDLMPLEQLGADRDIFLDPAGDDVNGDGTLANPWKTPQRAQDEYQSIIPGDFLVNINVAKGIYTGLSQFDMKYEFGAALRWLGERDTLGPYNFSNFSAVQTDANFPDLEFIDFDISFTTGDDFQVGFFVKIESPSGGTNPEATIGLHRVEAVDTGTDTATVRVWRRLNTAELPSGAISGSVELIKSVFQFPGTNGIFIEGPVSSGQWGDIVIEGDATSYDTKHGVECRSGGVFLSDGQTVGILGIHSFRRCVVGSTGGTIEIKVGGFSKVENTAIVGFAGSIVVCNFTCTVNGVGLQGAANTTGGRMDVTRLKAQACTRQNCISADVQGLIDARLAEIFYDSDGANTGIKANEMSSVAAEGAVITGFATNTSPAADTVGNDNSYVST